MIGINKHLKRVEIIRVINVAVKKASKKMKPDRLYIIKWQIIKGFLLRPRAEINSSAVEEMQAYWDRLKSHQMDRVE